MKESIEERGTEPLTDGEKPSLCTMSVYMLNFKNREKRSWEHSINYELRITNYELKGRRLIPAEFDSPIAQLVRALH